MLKLKLIMRKLHERCIILRAEVSVEVLTAYEIQRDDIPHFDSWPPEKERDNTISFFLQRQAYLNSDKI